MEVVRFGIIVAFCLYNDLKFIRDFLKYSLVFYNGVSVIVYRILISGGFPINTFTSCVAVDQRPVLAELTFTVNA